MSTHLKQLFGSSLRNMVTLRHFQIGSEGRTENILQKLGRFFVSPFVLLVLLLRHRPDIVHLNTSLEPKSYWRDITYMLVAHLLRCRVIYQVHGGALPEDFFSGNTFLTSILHRELSMPDEVVVLAHVELISYKQFVPKQRLEVVPNAIDATSLVRSPISVTRLPLQLTYLGRLAGNKGIHEAIEALAILTREGRDLYLSIAGSGPDDNGLRQQVDKLGLTERVHFHGALFDTAKDTLWSASDIFVFPTYHVEGLPYALLEAMAAGAVPITTRVGAIPDVIQDGVHGLLINAKDPSGLARAIARLDDDRELLARLAKAGRERVLMNYSVERLANEFSCLYSSVVVSN
ncbi:MAG: glycosyltransferase family 4 protein [Thiobacillaceae bacterium]